MTGAAGPEQQTTADNPTAPGLQPLEQLEVQEASHDGESNYLSGARLWIAMC